LLQVGGLVRGLVGPLVGNIGGASMWRCSQPKVRLQGNGSSADSLFLKHLLESASSADDKSTDIVHPRSFTVIECGESRSLSSWNRRASPSLVSPDAPPAFAVYHFVTGLVDGRQSCGDYRPRERD